jgi:methionyl-tRNA synthetase
MNPYFNSPNSPVINIILLILIFWTIPWKIYAVWLSAKRDQKIWFVVLLFVNTIGILEIIYIFKIAKKSCAEVTEDFKNALRFKK